MKKVLIVEDEKILADLLAKKLKEESYDISLAHDGQEAFRKIREEKPDLILLDIIMPILSGLDFLKKIKKEDVKKVIVVSVVKDKIRRKKAKEIGVKHYISKPFKKESLLKEVNKVLKRK